MLSEIPSTGMALKSKGLTGHNYPVLQSSVSVVLPLQSRAPGYTHLPRALATF